MTSYHDLYIDNLSHKNILNVWIGCYFLLNACSFDAWLLNIPKYNNIFFEYINKIILIKHGDCLWDLTFISMPYIFICLQVGNEKFKENRNLHAIYFIDCEGMCIMCKYYSVLFAFHDSSFLSFAYEMEM